MIYNIIVAIYERKSDMLNITYEYIDYKNTLFNNIMDFRYNILF